MQTSAARIVAVLILLTGLFAGAQAASACGTCGSKCVSYDPSHPLRQHCVGDVTATNTACQQSGLYCYYIQCVPELGAIQPPAPEERLFGAAREQLCRAEPVAASSSTVD